MQVQSNLESPFPFPALARIFTLGISNYVVHLLGKGRLVAPSSLMYLACDRQGCSYYLHLLNRRYVPHHSVLFKTAFPGPVRLRELSQSVDRVFKMGSMMWYIQSLQSEVDDCHEAQKDQSLLLPVIVQAVASQPWPVPALIPVSH